MKRLALILILIGTTTFWSCKPDEILFTYDSVEGLVQKGPFLNGTSITLSELNSNLNPTGRNFTSQILDNLGSFEVTDVGLSSSYVMLRADGFYFDEVQNSNSTSQLTLYALADLSEATSLNVNVLSDLEKSRVDYLLSGGSSFREAKSQAQREILSTFEIQLDGMPSSEQLDISKSGDFNAILLAISVIVQGYLPVSDVSELLANFNSDFRKDGQLNSASTGTLLINNARAIKLPQIRENLEKRYESLGVNTTIPDFEKYVNQFIANTEFEATGFIDYPATGKYGINLLDQTRTEYPVGTCSMKAVLPKGSSLKVKLIGRNWLFQAFQTNTGWEYSNWNDDEASRTFTALKTGEIDFEIKIDLAFSNGDNVLKVVAYENDSTEPSWTKDIIIK